MGRPESSGPDSHEEYLPSAFHQNVPVPQCLALKPPPPAHSMMLVDRWWVTPGFLQAKLLTLSFIKESWRSFHVCFSQTRPPLTAAAGCLSIVVIITTCTHHTSSTSQFLGPLTTHMQSVKTDLWNWSIEDRWRSLWPTSHLCPDRILSVNSAVCELCRQLLRPHVCADRCFRQKTTNGTCHSRDASMSQQINTRVHVNKNLFKLLVLLRHYEISGWMRRKGWMCFSSRLHPNTKWRGLNTLSSLYSYFVDLINQSSLCDFRWNLWEPRTYIVVLHQHLITHRPCGAFHHLLIHSFYYHSYHCWEDVTQINLRLGCRQVFPSALIYLDKVVKSYDSTGTLYKNTALLLSKSYKYKNTSCIVVF